MSPSHPGTPPDFFRHFPMRAVTSGDLDAVLAEPDAPPLSILFLWGQDCPNCDVAKHALLASPSRFTWAPVRWLHDDVYDDMEMGNRFALHGIPVFFLLKAKKVVGRITSWPGSTEFANAITHQVGLLSGPPPPRGRPQLTLVPGGR